MFALFVIAPMADGAWISLFRWDGVTSGTWVGLGNYRAAIEDAAVRTAFQHSLVLILFYAVLPVMVGLALTGLLIGWRVRDGAFHGAEGFALMLVFGFGMIWVGIWVGSTGVWSEVK